ncbi:43115_t:CDS:2 [Gigaspora margarita]|uniref:43115_t:CDS:1 n=1 Tax=Gigaspora margarita TaxID=4874 RepID=A0ABN7WBG5_GIGMA|nr:43115_t:CDS:2 [Gigaspora margarita]
MKNNTQEWLTSFEEAPTNFYNNNYGNNGVVNTDTVDIYISHFKQLKGRVNPNNVFSASVMIQFFIQELCPEYAMNV